MKTHVFRDNVNIHVPGSDPGARFYAWCWHTHFHGESGVSGKALFLVMNQQLILYHAAATVDHARGEVIITFPHEDDLTQFVLTWS